MWPIGARKQLQLEFRLKMHLAVVPIQIGQLPLVRKQEECDYKLLIGVLMKKKDVFPATLKIHGGYNRL